MPILGMTFVTTTWSLKWAQQKIDDPVSLCFYQFIDIALVNVCYTSWVA